MLRCAPIGLVMLLLAAAVAFSQDGPGGFPGGGPWGRGGGGWGSDHEHGRSHDHGGDRGGDFGDPAQRMARYEEMFRRIDTNGDGVVEPREIGDERWKQFMVGRMAGRAGIDTSRPFNFSQLRDGLTRYYQSSASGGPPGAPPGSWPAPMTPGGPMPPGSAPSQPTAPANPLVPGFGVAAAARPAIPGFGEPAGAPAESGPRPTRGTSSGSGSSPSGSAPSSESGTGGPSSSSSSKPAEIDSRIRTYAASLLKQYDKNGNNVLDKDEWGQLRGDPKATDRNNDGVITLDELTARLMEYSHRRSGDSGSSSGGSSQSGPHKTYRFLSATERLPEGLPEWFAEKDADEDGQVMMYEYSHSWSDATVAEFMKYDLNGDGVITPDECLKAEDSE